MGGNFSKQDEESFNQQTANIMNSISNKINNDENVSTSTNQTVNVTLDNTHNCDFGPINVMASNNMTVMIENIAKVTNDMKTQLLQSAQKNSSSPFGIPLWPSPAQLSPCSKWYIPWQGPSHAYSAPGMWQVKQTYLLRWELGIPRSPPFDRLDFLLSESVPGCVAGVRFLQAIVSCKDRQVRVSG